MTRTSVVRHWTTLVVTALMLLQLVPATTGASGVDVGEHRPAYVEGQVIVKYKAGIMAAQGIQSMALQSTAELTPLATLGSTGAQVLDIGADADVYDVVQELEQTGLFEYAQPNYIYQTMDVSLMPPNDPDWGQLWGLDNTVRGTRLGPDIGALRAWQALEDAGTELEEVIVAVIDTGIDINHADLRGMIWVNPACHDHPAEEWDTDDPSHYTDGCHGYNFVKGESTSKVFHDADKDAHGTHVAGTIAAVHNNGIGIAGVAPNVKIMALRFIDGKEGSTAEAIEAIAWANAHGAQVANMSFGATLPRDEVDQALRDAIANSDMVFAAAAGNYSQDNDIHNNMPANAGTPNLLSVAAVRANGEMWGSSNYGESTVHLGAPGHDIYSTLPGNRYGSMTGTSMAAPHVAGVAALLLGQKNLSPNEVVQLIVDKVSPLPSLQGKTKTGGMASLANTVATAVAATSVRPNLIGAGLPASLTIGFNVSPFGGLTSTRENKIHITFPDGFSLPDAVPANTVTINGSAVPGPLTTHGQRLSIPVPSNIGHGQGVEIAVSSLAGITNPDPGEYVFTLSTSTDPRAVSTTEMTIVPVTDIPPTVAIAAPKPDDLLGAAQATGGHITFAAAAAHDDGIAEVLFEQGTGSGADEWQPLGKAFADAESTYQFTFSIPDGRHTVRALAHSRAGGPPGISEPINFTVDTKSPAITITSPSHNETVATLTPEIGVSIKDSTSGVNWDTVQIQVDDKKLTHTKRTGDTLITTAPTLAEGERTLTVTAADKAGNVASRTVSFTVTKPINPNQNQGSDSGVGGSASGGGGGGGGVSPSGFATGTTQTIPETPTPHPIPPTGQTITDETTGLAITFPAQAVTTPINLTVQPVPPENQPPTNNALIGDLIVQIEAATEQGQPITTFQQPITLTFQLPPNTNPATQQTYRVFYWDPNASQWIAIPTRYDATNKTITGTTDHLTIFAVLVAPAFPRLTDIEGHWAEADILRLLSLDIAGGVGGSRFDTEGNVTRAQFARMLVRALGLVPIPDTHLTFSDADDFPEWAVFDITAAAGATIVQGLDGNRFGPAENITREQMATMIARALGFGTSDAAGPTSFTDDAAIADWARASVQAATDHGILSGIGGNTFAPKAFATRAQAARMIARMLSVRAAQQLP